MSDVLIITETAPEMVEVIQSALLIESTVTGDVLIIAEENDVVIIDGATETLLVEPAPIVNVQILTVGEQGPPGAGGSGGSTTYDTQLDFVSEDVTYRGDALPDTATSAASWRVCRITAGVAGEVTVEYADGSTALDKVWDNRASYGYV